MYSISLSLVQRTIKNCTTLLKKKKKEKQLKAYGKYYKFWIIVHLSYKIGIVVIN